MLSVQRNVAAINSTFEKYDTFLKYATLIELQD